MAWVGGVCLGNPQSHIARGSDYWDTVKIASSNPAQYVPPRDKKMCPDSHPGTSLEALQKKP